MQIDPIEQRIRDLCEKLSVAKDEEAQDLAAELRVAIREHFEQVRLITLKTFKHFPSNDSDSKATE